MMNKKAANLLAAACAAPLMMSPAFAYDLAVTNSGFEYAQNGSGGLLAQGQDVNISMPSTTLIRDGWFEWGGANVQTRLWNPTSVDRQAYLDNNFYDMSWGGLDASGDADGQVIVVQTRAWDYRPSSSITTTTTGTPTDLNKVWHDDYNNRVWSLATGGTSLDPDGAGPLTTSRYEWRFLDNGTPTGGAGTVASIYTYPDYTVKDGSGNFIDWNGTAVRNYEAISQTVAAETFDSTAKYKLIVRVGRLHEDGLNAGGVDLDNDFNIDAGTDQGDIRRSTRNVFDAPSLWGGYMVDLMVGGDTGSNFMYGVSDPLSAGYIQTLASDDSTQAIAADSWGTSTIEYIPGVSGDFSAMNGEGLVIRLAAKEIDGQHQNTTEVAFDDVQLIKIMAGDANEDDKVNGSDLALLAANFGQSGKAWGTGDFNGDGSVNGIDLALLAGNFGFDAASLEASIGISIEEAQQMLAAVPEPTSLALLGLGGLLIARRRRA